MSAKITWRALDDAGKARTEANRQACPPQTLAFTTQKFFWPCNLSQERDNFLKPVPKKEIPVNTPAPAIVQHHVSGGIQRLAHKVEMTVTYYHAFENSISGPWISGQGAIAGTSVTSRMSENSVTVGFARSF